MRTTSLPVTELREFTLKACPFCGADKASVRYLKDNHSIQIHCLECDASAKGNTDTKIAVASWNNRGGPV